SAGGAGLRAHTGTSGGAGARAGWRKGFGGPSEPMEDNLVPADVVVCSTAAPRPVITRARVEAVLKRRRHRPLFLVDLAVPRDVEPSVHSLDGVYAYDVDDIQQGVTETAAARAAAGERGEALVSEEVSRFQRQRAVREQVPVLAQLRARAEQIRKAELERALGNLPSPLTAEQARVVEAMTAAIVNKMLHQPTARLRAVQPGETDLADAAAELFGLEGSPRRAGGGES